MNKSPDVSIVGPVYKGQNTVNSFVKQTRELLQSRGWSYEIILVDDGCPDNSWKLIQAECEVDPAIKGLRLSRNCGQQIAVSAGMHFAQGERVVVMDTDLQNPIHAIPLIIENLDCGSDVVYTVSKVRNNGTDELTSILFWFLINRVLGVQMVPNQLMMKGFSRKFLEAFSRYPERVRVVAGIVHDIGMRSATLEVTNERRRSGKGNYSFFKRLNLMVDIVLALTQRPLNFLINLSILSLIASISIGVYTIINFIRYPNIPPGYATIITLISFYGSVTLLVLGIIGRYLSNIYTEVRQRPLFTVDTLANLDHG